MPDGVEALIDMVRYESCEVIHYLGLSRDVWHSTRKERLVLLGLCVYLVRER